MKTRKKPKSRTWLLLLLCALVLALMFGGAYLWQFYVYKRDVGRIQVQNVDLAGVADGWYEGSCDVGFIAARVRVMVRDHRIVDLELVEHRHGRGDAANAVADAIMIKQRLDVDAVTGATNSSKVIQEAMYNALTGRHSY